MTPLSSRGGRTPLRPKKSLGQHFLVDRSVLGQILRAADLSAEDVVVEVGPGKGVLTSRLVALVKRVVAVELDQAMVQYLTESLGDLNNVTIVHADAREVETEALVGGSAYKVIANLPYYSASPIIRRFLEAKHKPGLMVVMVQKEVAQNMAASPGSMSLLSIAIQIYGKPRIISYVPPTAFRPAPKVSSAIVRIDVYPRPIVSVDSIEAFFLVVKAGFSAPRKQLRNSLCRDLYLNGQEAEAMLRQASIDFRRRAETLSLEEWSSLYNVWRLNYRHADSQGPRQG